MQDNGFQKVLNELKREAQNHREQGALFEKLMLAFFRKDPKYKSRFKQVWLWDDWPQRTGADTGVDLVAECHGGEVCAIQCKFYAEDHKLEKENIDSFLNMLGKKDYDSGIIVATTSKWSKHAEDALKNRTKPCQRIDFNELRDSVVNWQSLLKKDTKDYYVDKKQLRPHQQDALRDVVRGFKESDVGKLIMPCGTGKTFTALKITERMVADNGIALVLMPSLSLVSQTLREWAHEAQRPLRSFVVCSDTKVGKKDNEDIQSHDLDFPPTTKHDKLTSALLKVLQENKNKKTINVIFCTYQSIKVISDAQKKGNIPAFDLVICDEAHRTTGVEDRDGKSSHFTQVHDKTFIKAAKRLYMTATPRIYTEKAKKKAKEYDVEVFSMDDEHKYGKELYRMDFSTAIEKQLLSDYKVCVFTVAGAELDATMSGALQQNSEINTNEAAKIVGCWNALAKRAIDKREWEDPRPIKRAVAFLGTIKRSKHLQEHFNTVINAFKQHTPEAKDVLNCEVRHVDGTQNALQRNTELRWLKDKPNTNECRILSNARCLSEGVDVPALDAVMFLNPRRSEIDVVQSVGRVMRKAKGKKYGYIILPIVISSGADPSKVLDDDKTYEVVWEILQALRSHDDRFDAMINKLELNKKSPPQLIFGSCSESFTAPDTSLIYTGAQISKLRDTILAKLVIKCGDRKYWDKWAKDIANVAHTVTRRINTAVKQTDISRIFKKFLRGLRENLNPAIDEQEAVEMLAQHMITKPVFTALFGDYEFVGHNRVSKNMEKMVQFLQKQAEAETKDLDNFYASIRRRIEDIDNAEGRQHIMKELYEKFFKQAFPKMSDRLGIVYTPNEVVNFILHSADHVLQEEFGERLSNRNVHIIDPFLGTGTFLANLLQSELIKDSDLQRKYNKELHANEIMLLAYYIGALNIESIYHDRKKNAGLGNSYETFKGIVLTDTFQIGEHPELGSDFLTENKQQLEKQRHAPIKVIVGNPPWSAGQKSENDANKNLKYEALDQKIRDTYVRCSTATSSKQVYDSYIRALRWASDRIGDNGVIAFVTNGNFIETPSMDGLRASLAKEFNSVHVLDLKGDLRRGGKEAGQGVFPIQTPVAITLLVKNKAKSGCKIKYYNIGDFLLREDKLNKIKKLSSIKTITEWQKITPNKHHGWINQSNPQFEKFIPIESKKEEAGVFTLCSLGIKTNRDAWVYNYDRKDLENNVKKTIAFYNSEIQRWKARNKDIIIDKFVSNDHKKISWSAGVKQDLKREKVYKYDKKYMRTSLYRPFCKRNLFYYKPLNERHYQTPKMFLLQGKTNLSICVSIGMNNYLPLMTNILPNYDIFKHLNSSGNKIFPRYHYDNDKKIDNINPRIVQEFQEHYGDSKIDADALFYYIYGLLHSKEYREKYKNNLRLDTPRIPYVKDFWQYANVGKKLAKLHVNYEQVKKYPLKIMGLERGSLRVQKMKHPKRGKENDLSTIIYNDDITISAIPEEAYRYEVAGRSAIWWIMNRYQVKTDKKSGIVNDPNTYSDDPRYIIDLLARIVTVSIESVKLIDSLPDFKEASIYAEMQLQTEVEQEQKKLSSTSPTKKPRPGKVSQKQS